MQNQSGDAFVDVVIMVEVLPERPSLLNEKFKAAT